jgi:hypothetical protein
VDPRDNPTELLDAEMHRRIAARIRRDPGVIAETRPRLVRIMAREPPPPDPALQEWLDLLLMATPDQVADFIASGTPRARRLRTSSPLLWLDR